MSRVYYQEACIFLSNKCFLIIESLNHWIHWRHNEPDDVLNHQRLDSFLNRLFRRRSKKNQSPASLAFVRGIHRWPMDSPHKRPVTRKKFHLMTSSWWVRLETSPTGPWAGPQAPLTPSNWSALYRGRGSPVMSWIFLKANNGQLDPGVGDKRFFCFKRNALYF